MIFFFENLFYQKQCKFSVNIGVVEFKGVFLELFVVKSGLSFTCRMLPLTSRTIP